MWPNEHCIHRWFWFLKHSSRLVTFLSSTWPVTKICHQQKIPFSHLEIELCLYSLKSFSLKWLEEWNSKLNTSSVDQISTLREEYRNKTKVNLCPRYSKNFVRSGIRTHASNWRPEHSYTEAVQVLLESGALDRSAILACCCFWQFVDFSFDSYSVVTK